MKASELCLTPDGFLFSTNSYPKGSHCKLLLAIGRALPTCKSQAVYFLKNKIILDVLNYEDVTKIESLLNKHGYAGDYKYTKSGNWVRLQNHSDLYSSLKKEFKN